MNQTNYQVKIDATVSNSLDQAVKKINEIVNKVDKVNHKEIDPKVSDSMDKAVKKVNELGTKLDKVNKKGVKTKIDTNSGKLIEGLKDKFTDLKGSMVDSAGSASGMGADFVKLGMTLGPVGLAVTAVAVALGGVVLHAFNLAKEFKPMLQAFQKLEKGGEALDTIVSKGQALKKVFGTDEQELAKTAKVLQQEFGISSVEAMDKLQKAMIATNGKLNLEDLNEFASQVKSVGGDVNKLLSVAVTSEQEGIFSNKSLDATKEFGIRIREGSDATKELLNSVGQDGDKIMKDIQSGAITQEQAFNKIFKNLDKLSVKKQQELISGLLGGAGEDLGQRGIKILTQLDTNLDHYIEKAGEGAEFTKKKLALEEELAQEQLKSAKIMIPLMEKMEVIGLKIQIAFEKTVSFIMESFVAIGDFFTWIDKKIEQTAELIGTIAQAIDSALSLDYTKTAKLIEKAKKQADVLFNGEAEVKVKKVSEATNTSLQPTLDDTKKTDDNKILDNQIKGNVDNAVAGATSTVKNITITVDSFQKIDKQIFEKKVDADEMLEYMNHGFTQILNDANAS